jgi:hypothetical protein
MPKTGVRRSHYARRGAARDSSRGAPTRGQGPAERGVSDRPELEPLDLGLDARRPRRYAQSYPERYLCRKMAAYSKYDRVRVDCATAGDIDTCLRIKMGDDFRDVETCGVDYAGGPAALLDPRTPNALRCFFLNASR